MLTLKDTTLLLLRLFFLRPLITCIFGVFLLASPASAKAKTTKTAKSSALEEKPCRGKHRSKCEKCRRDKGLWDTAKNTCRPGPPSTSDSAPPVPPPPPKALPPNVDELPEKRGDEL